MEPKKTVVINMISGPGSGKSTIAAKLFWTMKEKGFNVEYLQEYAKWLVWKGKFDMLNNQHIVSYKYYNQIKAMNGKVDYIVLDSSLLNGLYYNRNNLDNLSNVDKTERLILQYYEEFNNVNFVVHRSPDIKYETAGRLETETQSKAIDLQLINMLTHFKIGFDDIHIADESNIDSVLQTL